MPGVYAPGEYDLAGTIVGVVERERILDGRAGPPGRRVEPGDILIGLGSAGLHTNGYSLARKVLFERMGLTPDSMLPEAGVTVADALLAEHRSYFALLREPVEAGDVRALAHITGGGITDNLPRVLPDGVGARIRRDSWPVPPLFRLIGREGNVPEDDQYRTFNMGIGMIVIAAAAAASRVEAGLARAGERSWRIGEAVSGPRRVEYI
jgi:phosphoribosylformylglycinamidine cyclo-ligase